MKNAALLILAAVLYAHGLAADAAEYTVFDGEQHVLPAHQMQWHDTMDVIVDTKSHNVCYVTRQSDSHSLSTFCLPEHK